MFLAFKELKYAWSKFALITSVIILISYLVYFLTSLAFGLASSYTDAITKWDADEVVMTVDANDNLMMSYMTENDWLSVDVDGDKAKLGIFPAVINNPNAQDVLSTRKNVYFFGIDDDSFLHPMDEFELKDNDVIVDESLQKEGYKVGDIFGVSGSEIQFTIIGFSKATLYQTVPVVYMNLLTWQQYRFGNTNNPNLFSGVMIQGQSVLLPEKLAGYPIDKFINTLPGYTAQVLTFTVMIGFLILIVAFVIGIFIYVLTMQKTSMFGVMKAQGISNRYIGGSVIQQTILLVVNGIIVGLGLTLLSGFFLANILPFRINIFFFIVITIAFVLFAVLGALFSVRAVLKIDPLKAIGG